MIACMHVCLIVDVLCVGLLAGLYCVCVCLYARLLRMSVCVCVCICVCLYGSLRINGYMCVGAYLCMLR